jgi:hypothetical protein
MKVDGSLPSYILTEAEPTPKISLIKIELHLHRESELGRE